MIQGFGEFASRGNVAELAAGAIIDATFKNIVGILVDDIINPLITAVIDKPDFSDAFIFILNGIDVKFDTLISAVISFLLVAITLHLCIIVPINALSEHMEKQTIADEAEVEVNKEESDEVKLLTEIHDVLVQGMPHH